MQLKVLETKIIKTVQICAYSSTAWPISWDFQHQQPNASNSLTPAVFHCQNVTDHSTCLPHFLLPNAESKSSSRTDEIRHCDCHVLNSKTTPQAARVCGIRHQNFCAQASSWRHQITWLFVFQNFAYSGLLFSWKYVSSLAMLWSLLAS